MVSVCVKMNIGTKEQITLPKAMENVMSGRMGG